MELGRRGFFGLISGVAAASGAHSVPLRALVAQPAQGTPEIPKRAARRPDTPIQPWMICAMASDLLARHFTDLKTMYYDGFARAGCKVRGSYINLAADPQPDPTGLTVKMFTAGLQAEGVMLAATPKEDEFQLFREDDLRTMGATELAKRFLEAPIASLAARIRAHGDSLKTMFGDPVMVSCDLPLPEGLIHSAKRRHRSGICVRMVAQSDINRCPTKSLLPSPGCVRVYDICTDNFSYIPAHEVEEAMLLRFDVAFGFAPAGHSLRSPFTRAWNWPEVEWNVRVAS